MDDIDESKKTFGYKRYGTEQWHLPNKEGIIWLFHMKIFSEDFVKTIFKIGRKLKKQQFSDYIAYHLTRK